LDLVENPLLNTRDGQLSPLDLQELPNNNDDLYWENDEIVIPTQVISDLSIEEENSSPIDEGSQTTTTPSKKVISRNVSNSQRRRFR
jgi:hypothetical protein